MTVECYNRAIMNSVFSGLVVESSHLSLRIFPPHDVEFGSVLILSTSDLPAGFWGSLQEEEAAL